MKILLIHQLFAGPHEPGGTRHWEFSKRWVAAGHQVTVVASDRSYLSGQLQSQPAKGDSCRRKPSRWIAEQNLDGVRLLRARTINTARRGLAGRVLAFVWFMVMAVWAGLRVGRMDVVIGTSPPIFQLVSAWLVSVIRRVPFVLEVRDLWPDFAVDMGVLKNPAVIWLARQAERFLYRQAQAIVVNSPAYVDHLQATGIPRSKIHLVANGVDPSMFTTKLPLPLGEGRVKGAQPACPDIRSEFSLDGKLLVTYAGALGMANDIPTLLRVAGSLQDDADIHFLFVGGGSQQEQLRREASSRGLKNVTFVAALPKSRMREVLAASDVCVAALLDIPMFRMTYPNKVFDYMAAGKPTVLAIDGVIREVLEQAQGGICVRPGDDAALAEAIRHLHRHPEAADRMGQSARAFVAANFHRDEQSSLFERLLVRVVQRPASVFENSTANVPAASGSSVAG